jgi:hypothetical protein
MTVHDPRKPFPGGEEIAFFPARSRCGMTRLAALGPREAFL